MDHKSLRTTGSPHRSQLADSSWPVSHLAILLVATPPCDHKACSQTKRIYVAFKVLLALKQLHLPNHAELVQPQGLIALYECGHGMLEHAHVTLNSAFTMAARLDVDLSSILTSLEWRLSLMLIYSLVALQTLHRKHNWIPLACPPDHDMVRAIKHNFAVLRTPNGVPRPEIASQRVLDLGKIVSQCGRILQHVHDSKRNPRTANPHCELIVEVESSIPPFGEDAKHVDLRQSSRLPTSPIQRIELVIPEAEKLSQQIQLNMKRVFIRQCCARASVDAQFSFAKNPSEDEHQKHFSLLRLVCMLHNVLVTLKIACPGRYDESIASVIPEMRRISKRWPAAGEYFTLPTQDWEVTILRRICQSDL
ncbi:uncharacterized protein FMAN_03407 [Fusarium mangiferae]|uniref:Uncharacterized protein n=1 Tax=Fusarium mangiferae TaxID=192010 RepID=A0A1L7TBP5_FUSMA|nr:uncharacterized protein FMAN_03407 [Fusarium mangiferae]CVK94212.1 uncharacterized protein FMAN_03407 [Fusarium mangiferae]